MTDIGLSDAELTVIRADVNALLPSVCTIQLLTTTANAIGEAVKSYSTRAANVACRLDPMVPPGGWETLGGFMDIVKYMGKWILTLPYDTIITLSDRVIVGEEIFEVDHLDDDKSWKASVRCTLEKVTP